jgi:hypothetical protein
LATTKQQFLALNLPLHLQLRAPNNIVIDEAPLLRPCHPLLLSRLITATLITTIASNSNRPKVTTSAAPHPRSNLSDITAEPLLPLDLYPKFCPKMTTKPRT